MSYRARSPHVVYRCYDSEGLLLYIGCTYKVAARFLQHKNSAKLASAVLMRWMARRTEVVYPTKFDAEQAEKRAIGLEKPLLNTQHQKVGYTPASRRAVIYAYVAYAEQRTADALAAMEAAA